MEQHNRFGPEPVRYTQVMYRGTEQAAPKNLRATFPCTAMYTAVENTGSQTTQTPNAP